MLLKEYRIPLPLSVEEYRVAQLYMIAKKSREESKGVGSGVEIMVNEPYTDGPGGSGQYTHKIYHIGSHLPGWFKALLPKSALTVEEEAWNAYPYTKTRYTCPFIERFYLEIETKYFADAGEQENVFELSGAELRNLQVDLIDVVKDQLTGSDYVREEDPKLYISAKTSRGPLDDDWIQAYLDHRQLGTPAPPPGDGTIMCAYKLCRVEFRYWGMQSKIEKFIHDVALRKTMLRAHRQAWAWQDEWVGLTMEDIRQIERETQEALARKMAADQVSEEGDEDEALAHSCSAASMSKVDLNVIDKDKEVTVGEPVKPASRARSKSRSPPRLVQEPEPEPSAPLPIASPKPADGRGHAQGPRKSWVRSNSKGALHSPSGSSTQSFDLQLANWRMESIVRESDSSSNDEFFDAEDICGNEDYGFSPMTKWSSLEMVSSENEKGGIFGGASTPDEDSIFSASHIRRTHAVSFGRSASTTGASTSLSDSPTASPGHQAGVSATPCPTSVLVLVLHAGNVLDSGAEGPTPKTADLATFRAAMDSAIRQHYPTMLGRVALRLVTCPAPCAEALAVLSNLSPYSFQASPSAVDGGAFRHQDSIPLGALPLFAVSSPDFPDLVSRTVCAANQAYHDFLKSEQGQGFAGQVALIGDSVGSILGFDALCRAAQMSSRYGSENSINEETPGAAPRPNPLISISDGSGNEDAEDSGGAVTAASSGGASAAQGTPSRSYRKSASHPPDAAAAAATASEVTGILEGAASFHRLLSAPPPRRSSSCSSEQGGHGRFDFEVSDFFMFGSPIALVMAYRKMLSFDDKNAPLPRPQCSQVYNLFHPTDPLAARLEPLLSARFSQLPPVNVPRYQKYPLGDGQPIHLLEYLQSHAHIFVEGLPPSSSGYACMGRRTSEASISSTVSGVSEALPLSTVTSLTQKWWGSRRLDFALYCPEGLANFPPHVLPHLFHASYWESMDVVGLLLRQLLRGGCGVAGGLDGGGGDGVAAGTLDRDLAPFVPGQPREKWLRKRTSVKIKNVTANHRANDVIVKEGEPQVLTARFMYGPLDMVALSGEKVDVHLMRDSGHWTLLGTQLTDRNGRLSFSVPKDLGLGYGLFPVKAIVRGDHTSIDFFLAIVPPKTECVVFSIDGSFTASVSVSGRDPKVRAGAVDVVRHWQELGYLIIYITGRPDMQQQRVVSWLAQHNFPHGLVSFAEGLSTEPLRHKLSYLRHLQTHAEIVYHAAYGSAKDIAVYSALGMVKEQIFIVGKVSKKQHSVATVLSEGYALHLTDLKSPGLPLCRPAQGNARMVLSRGCFGLPGQGLSGPASALRRRRSAKRTTSYPLSASPASPGPSSTSGGALKTGSGSSKV
ncbi:protein retinal degeneration B [Dermacentor andersoni]|uniref:protein retinal degeneration B n=1 Tax=Dermacentor andersoni TaxID=34620 RepID=UPI002155860B|nr:protein retinal degeneration B-like [Dermacentor andersoni]